MKKSLRIITALSLLTAFTFTGCHREETAEVDNETTSAVDNAIAEQEFMAVAPAVQSHAINTKGTGSQIKGLSMCDTLALVDGDTLWNTTGHVNPVYEMNVSNQVCSSTMPDMRTRTGKLRVRLTGKIKDAGSKMFIRFNNYKSENISYNCDSLIITTVASNSLYTTFNIVLLNGVCHKPGGWTIKYAFNRTITYYNQGDPTGTDPVTYIYGLANGTNRDGVDFSLDIPQATPLVKKESCQYISAGIMNLTPKDFATRTIDYGYSISPAPYNGCDEDASFTVNGNTIVFKLK